MDSKRHLFRLLLISVVACSLIMLAGCGEQEPSVDESLTIYYFQDDNPAISTVFENHPDLRENIHTDDNGWRSLLQVDLSKSDAVIYEDDIRQYDWKSDLNIRGGPRQKITLDDDIHKRVGYAAEEDKRIPFYGYGYFVMALGDDAFVAGDAVHELFPSVYSHTPLLYYSNSIASETWAEENPHDTEKYLHLLVFDPDQKQSTASFLDELNPNMRLRLEQIGVLTENGVPTNSTHKKR